MKLIKTNFPKQYTYHHTDILMLTVHCITELGDATPEQVASRIAKNNWMAKDSGSRHLKDLIKHVTNAWPKAKLEIGEQGTKHKEDRLTGPEKIERVVQYLNQHVVYDTFKNSFINTHTNKETTPIDLWIAYNYLKSKETFIELFYFESVFQSIDVPKVNPLKQWADNLPYYNKKQDVIKQLCQYVPARDPAMFELYLKTWLIRTYIQAVNPYEKSPAEIVNRHFLILQSDMESSGKSSFLQWLAPNIDWVQLSGIEQGKDGKRALAEYMIIVDDEMSGITQFKEHEAFKSLISMSKINVRFPYAKKDSNLLRTASFCGSCNNARLFPIGEQSTRFLCVPLLDKMFDYKNYTKLDKQLLWAQVKHLAGTNWLEANDEQVRQLRNTTNQEFERESLELHAVESHIRHQLPTDLNVKGRVNQWGKPLPVVLRTGDVLNLLRTLAHYKNAHLNINVVGAALRKLYGPPIKGYSVQDLIVNDKPGSTKYTASEARTHGYEVYFEETGVKTNHKPIDDEQPKKSTKSKVGYTHKKKTTGPRKSKYWSI